MKPPKNSKSCLLGGKWDVQSPHGVVELVNATREHGSRVEREWERQGRLVEWSWLAVIVASYEHDRFAIVSARGELLALASSKKKRLLDLPSGRTYRLDFFEVAPRLVGQGFGYFAFAIVASRAAELGASGLVLGSVPQAVDAYTRYGGTKLEGRGLKAVHWKTSTGLVPFHFNRETLTDLSGDADGWKIP